VPAHIRQDRYGFVRNGVRRRGAVFQNSPPPSQFCKPATVLDNAVVTGGVTGLTADERALCERLIGHATPITDAVVAAARRHRVHLLLAASLTAAEREDSQHHDLLRELRTSAVTFVRREALLRDVLARLSGAGIDALVIKGAALAYTIYREPHLRPRVDVDLLVPRASIDVAGCALVDAGWARDIEPDAEIASGQRHYHHALAAASVEHLDLHWRVANPLVFARALPIDDVRSRAVAIPSLGPAARTPCPGDALLLACVHLVAHHGGDGRQLLWLLDVHLLAESLDRDARAQVVDRAARAGLRGVCRTTLLSAAECFRGRASIELAAALQSDDTHEALDGLVGDVSRAKLMRADLQALPTWSARVALVREHLFPPMTYIRARYPRWPRLLLPFAVLHRIAAGARPFVSGELRPRDPAAGSLARSPDGEGDIRPNDASERSEPFDRAR
jgi:hypothetical protein